jgi:carboxyl-terminal processing protease
METNNFRVSDNQEEPFTPSKPLVVYKIPFSTRITIIIGGVCLTMLSFVAGMIFTIHMQNTVINDGILKPFQEPILRASNIPVEAHKEWVSFTKALGYLNQVYYQREKLDFKKIVQDAGRGAFAAVGDPFTEFVPPKESKARSDFITGNRGSGIGVIAKIKEGKVFFEDVYVLNPADKAGVKTGDVLLKVEDKPVVLTGDDTKDLEELTKQLRGEANTKVKLTLQRPSEENKILDIEVTRGDIIAPSVRVRLENNNIGYIKVSVFGENTMKEFDILVKRLLDQNIQSFVLDLRDNGGGLVTTAKDLLSRFIENGTAFYAEVPYKGKDLREEKITENKDGLKLYDKPVVVLVNKNSASASEIVAGAMQDKNRAALIGDKTYGKAVAQSIYSLFDGSDTSCTKKDCSTARITFEKWLTPITKTDISKNGLAPNISISRTEEQIKAGQDPQLERALKFLTDKEPIPVVGTRD